MKQIKASEVKPGMTIRWETEMKIKGTTECNGGGGVLIWGDNRGAEYLDSGAPVAVLSEPAPPQPEEPTEFGAKVVVNGRRFLRSPEEKFDIQPWLEENEGIWRDWDELTSLGPVTVVPDQGWAVPADTPEVPERIEEC